MNEQDERERTSERLNGALRRVVLLKETGPKSAAWHRARVQTIWRLHRLIEEADATDNQGDGGIRPRRP